MILEYCVDEEYLWNYNFHELYVWKSRQLHEYFTMNLTINI